NTLRAPGTDPPTKRSPEAPRVLDPRHQPGAVEVRLHVRGRRTDDPADGRAGGPERAEEERQDDGRSAKAAHGYPRLPRTRATVDTVCGSGRRASVFMSSTVRP